MPDDYFRFHAAGLDSPLTAAVAVTPSDAEDLEVVPRCLFCTAGGVVRVTMRDRPDPVVIPIFAGIALPLRVVRVWATGTTAAGLVAAW